LVLEFVLEALDANGALGHFVLQLSNALIVLDVVISGPVAKEELLGERQRHNPLFGFHQLIEHIVVLDEGRLRASEGLVDLSDDRLKNGLVRVGSSQHLAVMI